MSESVGKRKNKCKTECKMQNAEYGYNEIIMKIDLINLIVTHLLQLHRSIEFR